MTAYDRWKLATPDYLEGEEDMNAEPISTGPDWANERELSRMVMRDAATILRAFLDTGDAKLPAAALRLLELHAKASLLPR
jgi:hypothetical protein